ncbi:MAG: peroxidase family protein [Gemmataceae bacterium]
MNVVTAWLDGSQVYGFDPALAERFGTFVGGRMKTSLGDLLPFNTLGLENQNRPLAPRAALPRRRHPRQREHRA